MRPIKEIKNPKMLQVTIEEETWRRLRHVGVDRNYPRPGLSFMVQEALEMWLAEEEKKGKMGR